uniref:Uncharacterized protein n=1 Tax=Romanomermis culicivorax TaxID=13658 RepID=A0A915LA73_ROMCU
MKDQPTAYRERIVSFVMLILALGKMFEPIILIIRQTWARSYITSIFH